MAKGEGSGGCGGCGIQCMKYLLFFFNVLFWLGGLIILAIGIWIRVDPDVGNKLGGGGQLGNLHTGAYVLIALGAFIAIVGFLGCCGAMKESQCMLTTFFIILFLVFLILLIIGIWLVASKDQIKEEVTNFLKEEIRKAKSGDKDAIATMDTMQKDLKCCGVTGVEDWKGDEPDSCKDEYKHIGCQEKAWAYFKGNVKIIAGVAIGIALIMILGMVFSMCLCCAIRKGAREY